MFSFLRTTRLQVGLLLLCGLCAGARGQNAPVISILWAEWQPADALAHLGKLYEAETGIAVRIEQIPWSQFRERAGMLLSRKSAEYDILVGDNQWLGEAVRDGHYLELTDWLKDPANFRMQDIVPGVLSLYCEYPRGSGRYYGTPCEVDAVGFAYRKDLFDDPDERAAFLTRYGRDLSPPETWEDFYQIAEFFTRPRNGLYGCALFTDRTQDCLTVAFQQFMWSYGGRYSDEKYQVRGHLNSTASVAALEFLKSLLKFVPRGGADFSPEDCTLAFGEGQTAMTMMRFSDAATILEGPQGKAAGFFATPGHRQADNTIRRATSLCGQTINVISHAGDERNQRALGFVRWFSAPAQQRRWAELGGLTADRKVIDSDSFKSAVAFHGPFAGSLAHARDFWNIPEYEALLRESQQSLGRYVDARTGPPTAQETLDGLCDSYERIFREAGYLQ